MTGHSDAAKRLADAAKRLADATMRLAAGFRPDLDLLLYAGPPFLFGWWGLSVVAPLLWWSVLAVGALFSEYRPGPDHDELKQRPVAFAIALVAFVAIHYAARWLSQL
jgi:hypothetical protein